ncbi:MAG: 4-hydroxy-3-methylbut-2-enyl diphosphate reductase [bacterium]
MEIIKVKNAGFCFGVKRAIDLAFESAKKEKNHVYTLGPLIHNPQVCEKLKEQGIIEAKNLNEIKSGVVILRSHGVPPNLYKEIFNAGLKIVDAVCPSVKKVQSIAHELKEEGYEVIVVGEKNHPEVKSIIGTVEGDTIVVEGPKEAEKLKIHYRKIGIIAQTTQTFENFKRVVEVLLDKAKELKINNTICKAVENIQKDSLNVAKQVDLMLVVGGKNSANTNRLFQLCKTCTKHIYHIETADEIELSWLKGVRKIGITGGTSTPHWIIEQVENRLKQIAK